MRRGAYKLEGGEGSVCTSLSNFELYLSFEQVVFIVLFQNNVQMNYVLNLYLSFGRVSYSQTPAQLSHEQNKLSRMSAYCDCHSLGWERE